MNKRKYFTRDFKLGVLREIDGGLSVAEAARMHEVHPNLIYRWQKEYRGNPKEAFAGSGNRYKLEAKLAERERLIGKLYAENELLKKAMANLRDFRESSRKRARGGGST